MRVRVRARVRVRVVTVRSRALRVRAITLTLALTPALHRIAPEEGLIERVHLERVRIQLQVPPA